MTLDRVLAILGLLGTVCGVLLAVYFFRRSEKKRVPTFLVDPRRQDLVLSDLFKFPGFSVFHNDQEIHKIGLTFVRVFFWNSGALPILRQEVLRPFVIRMNSNVRYFEMAKASRDVVGMQLTLDDNGKELKIEFNLLEPDDGATIGIIHEGGSNTKVDFEGACVGARKPTVLPSDSLHFMPPSKDS